MPKKVVALSAAVWTCLRSYTGGVSPPPPPSEWRVKRQPIATSYGR